MANFFKDNDDLRFYLDKGIDWTPIVELTERLYTAPDGFENKDEAVGFYGEVLDLIGSFVGDEIAPHVAEVDREGVKLVNGEAVHGPRLDSIMEGLKGLDLHGMCLPRELNGQNMPLLVFYMTLEMLGRADVSISAHHGFHGGMALAMLAYSLKEGTTTFDLDKGIIATTRFADYIEELRRGDVWGSMDITEPTPAPTWPPSARPPRRTRPVSGASAARRSSSPPATANTTSSSPAPRSPPKTRTPSPASLASPCSSCPPGARTPTVTASATSPSVASRRSSAITAQPRAPSTSRTPPPTSSASAARASNTCCC